MADYKTHLTCSTVAGIGLGCLAHYTAQAPISLCLFSGALCSVGGIVPDIDSKTSRSFQRILSIISGFVALMLVSRLRDFTLTPEAVVIVGGGVFIFTWGFVGTFIKKLTRHRGMCHSIPAALISGEIIYILSSGDIQERLFKGFAMFLGVMVHLILDEFYSVQITTPVKGNTSGKRTVYIKKSLGTALKMIDFENVKSTVVCFLFLAVVTDVAINEPVWSASLRNDSEKTAELRGKKMIDHAKILYPVQFDMAIVEWVAENKMVLEPGSPDNAKWKELETLFETNGQAVESGEATEMAASQQNGLKNDMAGNGMVQQSNGEPPSDPSQKKLSFLEQINWSNKQKNEAPGTSLLPLFRSLLR